MPILNAIPSDGLYSERQIKQIADNEVLQAKIRSLSEDWVRWWASADQPEISLEAIQSGKIKIVVRFDPRDPEWGEKALVILMSEDHPGQIITQPWDTVKGELMEEFPENDPQL